MAQALLKQKSLFENHIGQVPRRLSAYSFISLFTWKDFFTFDFKTIDGHLCIFAKHDLGTFMYLPPLGKNVAASTIEECFRLMEEKNGRRGGVARIENVQYSQLHLFPQPQYKHYKKGYEYCYRRQDIAGLSGNAYKSKRASYNQFVKKHKARILPYEPSMKDDCLKLYASWAKQKETKSSDPVFRQMLEENQLVLKSVLEFYTALGLIGRCVFVNDELKAFTFGYESDATTFCILFEIADLSFNGLAVYIFKEFCADAELAKYSFINVMDDFGLDNIADVKMSFHPAFLCPAYVVSRQEA